MITAQKHGWDALRRAVVARDRYCISKRVDVFFDMTAHDQCRDGFGWPTLDLEFDHVKQELAAAKKATDDEAHGVAVCAWHHRLSKEWRSDSKEHRTVIRAYLRKLYPGVWGS